MPRPGNRFRQVAEINVDVVRKIRDSLSTPDDADTYFYETLDKLADLHTTHSFDNFLRDLPANTKTLPQLLLRVKDVIECLKTHLQVTDSENGIPLFELIIALARDLQHDFYPYFADFFGILIKFLSVKNAECIQAVFKTLAYLFKFLWRYMINDFKNVLRLYFPLFSNKYPYYVKNFSAESIAFLLRKVRNKDELLTFIFESLRGKENYAAGTGKLLFEVVRGIKHHFHSSFDEVFYLMLSKLGQGLGNEIPLPWDEVVLCQLQMINSMFAYTTRELSSSIWNILMKVINELNEKQKSEEGEKQELILQHLARVLQLLREAVNYNSTEYVQFSEMFLKMILDLATIDLSEKCSSITADIISSLLHSEHFTFDLETVNFLLSSIYNSKSSWKWKLSFTEKMYTHKEFEEVMLEHFVKYCDRELANDEHKEDVFIALTIMVIHLRPLPLSSDDLDQWKPFQLELSYKSTCDNKKRQKISSNIQKFLEERLVLQDASNFSHQFPFLWSAIIVLPHIGHAQHTILQVHLMDLYSRLLNYCLNDQVEDEAFFLLLQVVETMLLTIKLEEIEEVILPTDVQNLLMKYPSNTRCLMLADFYISFMEKRKSFDALKILSSSSLYNHLLPNLAAPFHRVRYLTLRILKILHEIFDKSSNEAGIYTVCLSAENIKVGFFNFRERLRFLEDIQYESVHARIQDVKFYKVSLTLMIGMLHENFEPLWEPIMKIIETYARGMDCKEFWEIFNYYLKNASHLTEYTIGKKLHSSRCIECHSLDVNKELADLFNRQFFLTGASGKVDYFMHRNMLWKTLGLFHDICETQTQFLSPLLLQFMNNEYCYANVKVQTFQKIRLRQKAKNKICNTSLTPNVICEESNKAKDNKRPALQYSPKILDKALCAHLQLFSKFTHPHRVHRESDLRKLYFHLLMNSNAEVQSLALRCIMTYKFSFVIPYEDVLIALNEQRFGGGIRTSLVFNFKEVHEEHRNGLIPIMIRILFGKLRGKSVLSKIGLDYLKSVFKYFASLDGTELKMVLDLLLEDFQCSNEEDTLSVVQNILKNPVFNRAMPLSKQNETLKVLSAIFRHFSLRLTPHLPRLLKLLLEILAKVVVALENRTIIHSLHIQLLRELRATAMQIVIQIFDVFQDYQFSKQDIEALFLVAVWPQLSRVTPEGVTTESYLLKLFQCWSTYPRYFVLLIMRHPNDTTTTPFSKIMEFFVHEKTDTKVISVILNILSNLLTTEEIEATNDCIGSDGSSIEVDDVAPIYFIENTDGEKPRTLGTRIVLSHITSVLMKLKNLVENSCTSKKIMLKTSFAILTRLIDFVKDSTFGSSVSEVLIPFFLKNLSQCQGEELNLLSVVKNLIENVENPQQFIRPICISFGSQTNREARKMLCDILEIIAKRDESFSTLSNLATKLNSWNPSRPEEPGFIARISGYQNALQILREDCLDPHLYLLLICNSCYFINTVSDLTLKENASHCLQMILLKLGAILNEKREFVRPLLSELLRRIRKGLIAKNELIRHEFITLLSVGAQAFNKLPNFKDLYLLKHNDKELDFFENIKHVQISRRSRALSNLAKSEFINKFRSDFLLAYIKPFADVFLFNAAYMKHKALIAAAVELIAKISSCLPWHCYEKILFSYLNQLCTNALFQPVLNKLLIAVLDSFKFDLSKVDSTSKPVLPPLDVLNKEQEEDDEEKDNDQEMLDVSKSNDEQHAGHFTSAELAKEIHDKIEGTYLPHLYKCLTLKARKESVHNLAQASRSGYFAELLRIPVALVAVKLLQKLPKETLNRNVPGLLYAVYSHLKSRTFHIRERVRSTLYTISQSLGPEYLPFIVREMRPCFRKGYQVHVMIYTLHGILSRMTPNLHCGIIDPIVTELIKICHDELFGAVAEQKAATEFISKIPEGKSIVAYDMYKIMASFISSSFLADLIVPLKTVLKETTSHERVNKAKVCLENITEGILQNTSLQSKDLLMFSHGIINEHISGLKHMGKKKDEFDVSLRPVRPDTFLIPKEPGRVQAQAPMSLRTNAHVLLEFGIKLMLLGLKRQRITITEQQDVEMLDPFFSFFNECLHSSHVELILYSIKTLNHMVKIEVPYLQKYSDEIVSSLFRIVKHYNTGGIGQMSTGNMIFACYRLLTSIIKNGNFYTFTEDQVRILLVYVEQDIHHSHKQARAFNVLETILSRGLIVPEIHTIMNTVGELAISSPSDLIRGRCRQCMLTYLLDYPLGDLLTSKLEFVALQLTFEEEYGVESALELLKSIIMSFPESIVIENAKKFFVHLATSLVNAETVKCRTLIASVIKILLEKISADERTNLFTINQAWLVEEKAVHRKLGMQLSGIFIAAEKEKFYSRLSIFFPILIKHLQLTDEQSIGDDIQKTDHVQVQALITLSKLMRHIDIVKDRKWQNSFDDILNLVEKLLLHPHAWIKLCSSQIFGLLFTAYPVQQIVEIITSDKTPNQSYFFKDFISKLITLTEHFCAQLMSAHLVAELGTQIAKNMVYITQIVHRLPKENRLCKNYHHEKDIESDGGESSLSQKKPFYLTIKWLMFKMYHSAREELSNLIQRRTCFFVWIAAVSLDLGKEIVTKFLRIILPLLIQEINKTGSTRGQRLQNLAQEVLDLIKNLVGIEVFSEEYAKLQTKFLTTKAKRKERKAIEVVTNPEVAVLKKIKKTLTSRNLRKKLVAKRLREGKKPVKKSRAKKRRVVK